MTVRDLNDDERLREFADGDFGIASVIARAVLAEAGRVDEAIELVAGGLDILSAQNGVPDSARFEVMDRLARLRGLGSEAPTEPETCDAVFDGAVSKGWSCELRSGHEGPHGAPSIDVFERAGSGAPTPTEGVAESSCGLAIGEEVPCAVDGSRWVYTGEERRPAEGEWWLDRAMGDVPRRCTAAMAKNIVGAVPILRPATAAHAEALPACPDFIDGYHRHHAATGKCTCGHLAEWAATAAAPTEAPAADDVPYEQVPLTDDELDDLRDSLLERAPEAFLDVRRLICEVDRSRAAGSPGTPEEPAEPRDGGYERLAIELLTAERDTWRQRAEEAEELCGEAQAEAARLRLELAVERGEVDDLAVMKAMQARTDLHEMTCRKDSGHGALCPHRMGDGSIRLLCTVCDWNQPVDDDEIDRARKMILLPSRSADTPEGEAP